LNSATILNQHLPHGVGESSHHERPARGEVHYGDREELHAPLELPVGVAVGPVVTVGAHVLSPGVLWSTVSSMITATSPFTSLTGPPAPPRVFEFSQRLQQVCVVQPERLDRVPHADPPTYQDRED